MRITTANASSLFLAAVQKAVYQKELEYVSKHIEKFFLEYKAQSGKNIAGFNYMSTEYRFSPTGKIISLPQQYRTDIDVYLKDKMEIINVEQPYVQHFISQLLRKTKNLQSLREILPSDLHPYINHYLNIYYDEVPLAQEAVDTYKNHSVLDTIKYRLAANAII